MKITAALPIISALATLATAAALPDHPGQPNLQRAQAACERLRPHRREACLRSLPNPHVPDNDITPRDITPEAGCCRRLPNHSPDNKPSLPHDKRGLAVTPLDDGAVDLAIPVPGGSDWAEPTPFPSDPAPTPTTLLTASTTDSSGAHTQHAPIALALTYSLDAATTTYPATRATATLASGAEVRVEQTESQTHDVHVEETEREEGAPEEDRVVVHVKVFVEHVRELARRGVRMFV